MASMPVIRELSLYMTSRCNHRCAPCARQHGREPKASDVTAALVERVLEWYPTIQSVCVAGFGEPLLSPHLHGVLEVLADRRKTIGLITNGSRVPWHTYSLSRFPLAYVSVSVNAANADEHAAMVGVRSWEHVVAGIRDLTALGVPTGASFIVGRSNLYRISDYLETARDLGAMWCTLHNTLPHGLDSEILHEGPDTISALAPLYRDPYVRHVPTLITAENPHRCRSPYASIGIDGDGLITPCRRVHGPRASFGHYTDDLASIYRQAQEAVCGATGYIPECGRCFGNWSC